MTHNHQYKPVLIVEKNDGVDRLLWTVHGDQLPPGEYELFLRSHQDAIPVPEQTDVNMYSTLIAAINAEGRTLHNKLDQILSRKTDSQMQDDILVLNETVTSQNNKIEQLQRALSTSLAEKNVANTHLAENSGLLLNAVLARDNAEQAIGLLRDQQSVKDVEAQRRLKEAQDLLKGTQGQFESLQIACELLKMELAGYVEIVASHANERESFTSTVDKQKYIIFGLEKETSALKRSVANAVQIKEMNQQEVVERFEGWWRIAEQMCSNDESKAENKSFSFRAWKTAVNILHPKYQDIYRVDSKSESMRTPGFSRGER